MKRKKKKKWISVKDELPPINVRVLTRMNFEHYKVANSQVWENVRRQNGQWALNDCIVTHWMPRFQQTEINFENN